MLDSRIKNEGEMMETMEKCNIANRTNGRRRGVMNRYDAILNKVINWLYWENKGDLYMKQYMNMFSHDHSCSLEHNYGKRMPVKLQKPDWPPMGKLPHPL